MTEAERWLDSTHVTPICSQMGHRLRYRFLRDAPKILYQHGENPEAVFEINRWSFSSPGSAAAEVRRLLTEWVDRIHAYEHQQPERAGQE